MNELPPLPADFNVPEEWQGLARNALSDTVMLVGATDTGKSTLARWLIKQARSRGQTAARLDGDLGQSSLGIPGPLNLAMFAGKSSAAADRAAFFVGSSSPRGRRGEAGFARRAGVAQPVLLTRAGGRGASAEAAHRPPDRDGAALHRKPSFQKRGRGMNHDSPRPRHVLITGKPGCGKTTLLKHLAHQLRSLQPAGFYTEEVRRQGRRMGFRLVGLNGAMSLMAHVDLHGGPQVGRYGVDVEGLEDFLHAQKLHEAGTPLVFIDEIGKMECLSRRFVDLVRHLLDSPKTIIATVALKGGGLIAEVKQRPDVVLVEVGPGNRDRLVEDLANRIAAMAGR